MSIGLVRLALYSSLPNAEKVLLSIICDEINNEGFADSLKIDDISQMMNIGKRHALRLTGRLRKIGVLIVEPQRKNGKQDVHRYRVDRKTLQSIAAFRVTYRAQENPVTGCSVCHHDLIPDKNITPNTNPPNPPLAENSGENLQDSGAALLRTADQDGDDDLFELTPPPNNEPGNNSVVPESWIQAIFGDWQQILNHPRSALGPDKRKAIEKAYPWGYTREQYRRAFLGNKRSTYHQGFNDGNKKYDSIGLICRSSENLDRFMEYADNPPKPELHNSTMDRASQRMAMEEWRRHCRDAVAEVEPDHGTAAAEAAGGRVFENSTGNVIHGNF